MGDTFSMCCCAQADWFDLLLAGGVSSDDNPVGLHRVAGQFVAVGYPDATNPALLRLGRFRSPGDLDRQFLTEADAENSAALGLLTFGLQAELEQLLSQPGVAEVDGVKRAIVTGMLDLGSGGSLATIGAASAGPFGFPVAGPNRLLWLDAVTGEVAASYPLSSFSDEENFDGNWNSGSAPLAFAITEGLRDLPYVNGAVNQGAAWSHDEVHLYDPSPASALGVGRAVAVLTREGYHIEWIDLTATTNEAPSLDGQSTLAVPGVAMVGYRITYDPQSPPSLTRPVTEWTCEGLATGSLANVREVREAPFAKPTQVSLQSGDPMPDSGLINFFALFPNYTAVEAPSSWAPKALVRRRTHRVEIGSEPAQASSTDPADPNLYLIGGARVIERIEVGLGVRTGPSVIGAIQTPLYSVESAEGVFRETVALGDTPTDAIGSPTGVHVAYYSATDSTDVVIYGEGDVTVTVEEVALPAAHPTCPLGPTDADPETRVTHQVGVWDRTLTTTWRGQYLRSIVAGQDTKTPWLNSGNLHIWPFVDGAGASQRVPRLGRGPGGAAVYLPGSLEHAGQDVRFLSLVLLPEQKTIVPFWGAPTSNEAAFVVMYPWDGLGVAGGKDLVFFSPRHEILSVWRFPTAAAEVVGVTSQCVYVRLPDGDAGGLMITRDGRRGQVTQTRAPEGPADVADFDLPPHYGQVSLVTNARGRLVRFAAEERFTRRPASEFPVLPPISA